MSAMRLWLPGAFRPTNALLSLQRAEGFHEGFGKARGVHREPLADSFSADVERMRLQAKKAAFDGKLPRPFTLLRADVWFVLFTPDGRRDPDAWYLAGKAVLDGLTDAGVIRSDRRNVGWTWGRCDRVGSNVRCPDGECARSVEPGLLVGIMGADDEPV